MQSFFQRIDNPSPPTNLYEYIYRIEIPNQPSGYTALRAPTVPKATGSIAILIRNSFRMTSTLTTSSGLLLIVKLEGVGVEFDQEKYLPLFLTKLWFRALPLWPGTFRISYRLWDSTLFTYCNAMHCIERQDKCIILIDPAKNLHKIMNCNVDGFQK